MNVYVSCGADWNLLESMFIKNFVILLEGMSMGVLMLFHLMNFKQGSPILSHDDSTSVIIMREEFDTE